MTVTAPHLLVVDDDSRIRDLLKRFLQKNGFLVSAARDAAHAERLLAGLDFDLMICDVMMPGEDGVSFTRRIRRARGLPVLLLTARGGTEERIMGLEAGADDYLPKPFDPRELLLRLTAILRRVSDQPAPTAEAELIRLGARHFDALRLELWEQDERIPLTATEAAFMRIFVARPGETIRRAELAAELGRGDEPAQERAVDVQITRLRRKLEDDPRQPRFLQTIRGIGYMLVPE